MRYTRKGLLVTDLETSLSVLKREQTQINLVVCSIFDKKCVVLHDIK